MKTIWPLVPLGDLMPRATSSVDPRKQPDALFDLLSIPAFDAGKPEVVRGGEIGSNKQLLCSGDVVLSKIVPHIRRAGVVPPQAERPIVGSSEWIVFRSDRFVPGYLRHLLVADMVHRSIMQTVAGVGGSLLRARPSSVAKIEIPLPPIEEQRRIAAVLDAADALRAKRRQALAKLDTLTQAIFIDMFGDPFRPDSATKPLASMAEVLMGQSPPGASYNDKGVGLPLLNGPSEFGAVHPTAEQWTTAPTRLSAKGDILFCVRGATAGRINWSDGEYCLGRGLAAIRAAPDQSQFINAVLAAFYPRFQVLGVGSTFINISKNDLHQLPIPAADPGLMADFGARQTQLNDLKATAKVDFARFDALFASLQHRAFRGEL